MSRPPTAAAMPIPALAPVLSPVLGLQESPFGQVVEEACGLLVAAEELVDDVAVEDVGLEAEEV